MPTSDEPMPNVPIIHRPDQAAAGLAPLQRPPLGARTRLLVVDDEPAVVRLVARILAMDGYDIVSADSGDAAATLVADPGFSGVDLLVTDLMMPGMNGKQLAEFVRQRNPDVRVLYVTGFADSLFAGLKELDAGESFIEKPFGPEGLLEATRLLMFGHITEPRREEDKREREEEWIDNRLRARVIRVLRRLGLARTSASVGRERKFTVCAAHGRGVP
jgi:DNA-binding response OmpR family regulator